MSEPMRLRQSLSEMEQAFAEEIEQERQRRELLRRTVGRRGHYRQRQRVHKRGSLRYTMLVISLIATAALVTVVMFKMLYVVMG